MSKSNIAVSETKTTMPAWMAEKTGPARGSEDVGADDLTIPRLSIIQDLSPYHKKGKPEYIEGAEVGMCFNTVSKELYGDKIFIVPVFFRKEYIIWKDQAKGGGFFGSFQSSAEAETARHAVVGEIINDLEVVDTAQHFVLVLDESGNVSGEAVISMSKSQMGPNRKLNSQIRLARGDRFSNVYELSVVAAKNKANQEYQNWSTKNMGYVSQEVFERAEALYAAVKAGETDVSRQSEAASKPVADVSGFTEPDEF